MTKKTKLFTIFGTILSFTLIGTGAATYVAISNNKNISNKNDQDIQKPITPINFEKAETILNSGQYKEIVVNNENGIKIESEKMISKIVAELRNNGYETVAINSIMSNNDLIKLNIEVKINNTNKTKIYEIEFKILTITKEVYKIELGDISNNTIRDYDAFIGLPIQIQPSITKIDHNGPNAGWFVWYYENKIIYEASNNVLPFGEYIDQLGNVTFKLEIYKDSSKKQMLGISSKTYNITRDNFTDDIKNNIDGNLFAELNMVLTQYEKAIRFNNANFTSQQLKDKVDEIFDYIISSAKIENDFMLVWEGEPVIDESVNDTDVSNLKYKKATINFKIDFIKFPKIKISTNHQIKNFSVYIEEEIIVENAFADNFRNDLQSKLNESIDEYNVSNLNNKISAKEFVKKNELGDDNKNSWQYYVKWNQNLKNVKDLFDVQPFDLEIKNLRIDQNVYKSNIDDGLEYEYVKILFDFDYKGNPSNDFDYVNPEYVKDLVIEIKFIN